MTTKIILKKSSVSSNAPGTSDLDYGEMALNYADGHLYYKTSGNAIKRFLDSAQTKSILTTQVNNIVDSDFVALHAPDMVRLAATQTLTNKTLTAPKLSSTAILYGQTFGGVSFNKNLQLGDSTQSVVSIISTDSSRDAALAIGVDNQVKNSIGTVLDRDNNTGTMYFSVGNNTTDIKFTRRTAESTPPIDWNGVAAANGDDLLRIAADGVVTIPDDTAATNKTTGALVITGGLGVGGDIKASDIETSGNVQAQGAFIGNVTGTVSSLSNHNTGALSEGTNLYYTTTRADSDFDARLAGKTTTNLSEGNNKYYTAARADSDAKHAVSVTDAGGDGSVTYNSGTGVITYQGPVAADVRAHFSGGTGVTLNSGNGVISIGQAVGTSDTPTFGGGTISGNFSVTGDLTVGGDYILNTTTDLRVTNSLIKLADSNSADTVDIGIVGRYKDSAGGNLRRAGFFRDATNGEWYTFNNLRQDDLDSSPAASVINRSGPGFELGTWNFKALRGSYLGWDSDFTVYQSNYITKTANYTASAGDRIAANTTGGSWTLTLPANPSQGNTVHILDVGNWSDANKYLDVARNGNTIEGHTDNFRLDIGQNAVDFIFINNNWQVYARVGQRGEVGATGAAGTNADSDTLNNNAIAYAIALG